MHMHMHHIFTGMLLFVQRATKSPFNRTGASADTSPDSGFLTSPRAVILISPPPSPRRLGTSAVPLVPQPMLESRKMLPVPSVPYYMMVLLTLTDTDNEDSHSDDV